MTDRIAELEQCSISGGYIDVTSRECSSKRFDGIEYEFEAPNEAIDIVQVLETIAEWDTAAIENITVPPENTHALTVFVTDLPKTRFDGALVE